MTVPQVQASRPETLTGSAAELGPKVSGLASQLDGHRTNIGGLRSGWQGAASEAAVAKAQPSIAGMQQIHDALDSVQSALRDGGNQLRQTRTTLTGMVDQLTAQGWQVAPDGTVSVRPGGPLDQYAKASPANAMQLQQLAATNSLNVKTELATFDTTDRQLDQNLRNAVGGLDFTPLTFGPDFPQAPGYDTGAEIPVDKSPEEVHARGGRRSLPRSVSICSTTGPKSWAI